MFVLAQGIFHMRIQIMAAVRQMTTQKEEQMRLNRLQTWAIMVIQITCTTIISKVLIIMASRISAITIIPAKYKRMAFKRKKTKVIMRNQMLNGVCRRTML